MKDDSVLVGQTGIMIDPLGLAKFFQMSEVNMIYKRLVVTLVSLSFFLCCHALAGNMALVRHIKPDSEKDARNQYFIAVLNLALSKSVEEYGPYRLQKADVIMNQSRAFSSMENHKLDVVWSMTSSEREQFFTPVRIPLLKGLLGHRIFIIRKGDERRFDHISNLDQLRQLLAGQGHDWPDTSILRANKIKVVESSSYDGLFLMLSKRRFDYFPRGVNEPFEEVAARPDLNLIVEPRLLIRYPAPIFFFTASHNPELADRLSTGLRKAIADGSFNKLFHNHPSTRKIFEQANISGRITFELENPLLTTETRSILNNPGFWYQQGERN